MARCGGTVLAALLVVLAWPLVLAAQTYPSEKLSFEGTANMPEVFRAPTFSPSTRGLNTAMANNALRSTGWGGSDGVQALEVLLNWLSAADPYAWVRLTSYNGDGRPNPSLHTQGKVRFKIANRGNLTTLKGAVGLCIGIRETGVQMPQMWNGQVAGPIELVGVSTALSVIECGTNGCQSVLAGDDVHVNTNGLEAVNWGADRVLQTTAAGDDLAHFGYVRATNNAAFIPVPAVTVPVSYTFESFEVDLATGTVTYAGTPTAAGIIGLTGDGVLNPPNNRGTLESLIITNVVAEDETAIDFYIDELQFEAPAHDPVLAPSVRSPLVAADTLVTVDGLVPYVRWVSLYINDGLVERKAVSPATPGEITSVDFTVAALAEDDRVKATQEDSIAQVSGYSAEVTVLAAPPPYTFSILLDEGGTGSCTTAAPGWEWVPVSSVVVAPGTPQKWAPQGLGIVVDDAVWQTVDVPLDDDNLVIASLGGNGGLLPSPSGSYTIDSAWFSIAPGVVDSNGLGPWEVFIDAVQAVDAGGAVTDTILDVEGGVDRFYTERGQSITSTTVSGPSPLASYDGIYAHRLVWTYPGLEPINALGMLQRTGTDCGTATLIADTAKKIRFHLLCRAKPTAPTVPLPTVVGPIVVGTQNMVRVLNDAAATSVQLYVNGLPSGAPVTPSGTQTDFAGLTLVPGQSISATQTLPAGVSDYAYPQAVATAPAPPTVESPLYPTAIAVSLNNCYAAAHATASTVTVYVNGSPAGSAAGGTGTIVVSTVELQPGDSVTAKQTVNGVTSAESAAVIVEPSSATSTFANAATVAALPQAISAIDLINGKIGVKEAGGFHGATPGGDAGGLADLTDGVVGVGVEAVLLDYPGGNPANTLDLLNRALQVRYDFSPPRNLDEIRVFIANVTDPGNGRVFQNYSVEFSVVGDPSFQTLILNVTNGSFGQINSVLNTNPAYIGASLTTVSSITGGLLAVNVDSLRLIFYPVSNTGGWFWDEFHTGETGDRDGQREAFESSIVKEIDVFGFAAGDCNGSGDVDLVDYAAMAACIAGPSGGLNPGCGCYDMNGNGDVDLADFAEFQVAY